MRVLHLVECHYALPAVAQQMSPSEPSRVGSCGGIGKQLSRPNVGGFWERVHEPPGARPFIWDSPETRLYRSGRKAMVQIRAYRDVRKPHGAEIKLLLRAPVCLVSVVAEIVDSAQTIPLTLESRGSAPEDLVCSQRRKRGCCRHVVGGESLLREVEPEIGQLAEG